MATSSSYNFAITRDDIIREAYDKLGFDDTETINADLTTSAARKLNLIAKAWGKKGHLHALQDAVLFQVLEQQSYLLGDASTDANWCAWDDYAQTTLSAAAASGASTVTLTATTGFTASDRIGVVLDSGAIQWTTINGALSGSVATLTATLTGAAASGNVVFGYTSRLVRPLRIVPGTIYRRDINNNDTPIELIMKSEYDLLTKKYGSDSDGKTINVAYQPFLTSGRLWTWPTADLSTDVIRFTFERPLQDFDSSSDNPDLPIEAGLPLIYALAVELAPGHGAAAELPALKVLADEYYDDWINGDREYMPLRFEPNLR